MGTQCWEAEEDPWCEAMDALGAGLDAHSALLTLSQGWAWAPCPPCTTSSFRPQSSEPLGLYHPWVRFGAACVP